MEKSYYYKPLAKDNTEIERALLQIGREHLEEGYCNAHGRLGNEIRLWKHKLDPPCIPSPWVVFE
ncbi:hypothetical protein [Arenibacter algicola]|uniref:hypothetical protein n=1 Tax=Arenibacter algicola TaxID=616991 RepID=UPI0004DF7D5B|nr:hypothetical protein [Arenibacter algicola]